MDIEQQVVEREVSELESKVDDKPVVESDEIDLVVLVGELWRGKLWIIGGTFCFLIFGVLYALSLPNVYRSEGVYAPESREGGLGGIASQYGGLAAMAGINLQGNAGNDLSQALALATSWPFLERFIESEGIASLVLGAKEWNAKTGEMVWDEGVFDVVTQNWRRTDKGFSLEPTSYELYKELKSRINVSEDSKTGLITVSVEHYSPVVAKQWVEKLAASVNEYFRERDINEAQANITFLDEQISKTSVSDMRGVLYGMVEAQVKTLMMADVKREYLLKTVIPPKIAEEKAKPSRAVVVAGLGILGGALAVLLVLGRSIISNQRGAVREH